jgi:hypothetical protein
VATVAYRAQDSGQASPIIVIALKGESGGLRLLVAPGWLKAIRAEDVEHLEPLLGDFAEQAKEQPATLFKHLSSLEDGPLVTQETGENISDHPAQMELSSRFVQLQIQLLKQSKAWLARRFPGVRSA